MELTANIFIILSAILAATSTYFYLQNRRNKNKLETSNSLLKSEENHRIQLSTQILLCEQENKKFEEQAKKSLIEIKELESKLKFAINNPPKFKVGAKIKNVIVESVELTNNNRRVSQSVAKGLFFGLLSGIVHYFNSKKYIYKYKLIHKNHYNGQKLHKECEVLTEEQLLKLKNGRKNKANS